MILLSVLLAGTIAEPIRKLADAAQRVRRGVKSREQIPDFGNRHDEIGHLSGSLRDMTKALYSRIEAIESFAADVAHELKNPLTSLRSAVETLPRAKSDESRGRLLEVIQHDVRRLDRLISDISDASRLDAELARNDAGPVDLAQVLEAVVSVQNEMRREGRAKIELVTERRGQRPGGRDGFIVLGHDSRLGQVLVNLIDNARSFSPPDKPVRVLLSRSGDEVLVTVEDEGPGIEPHALERIFERFYTDRPNEGFGQNSGLGLSISRQIVEAHRGTIRAENRLGPAGPDGERPRLGRASSSACRRCRRAREATVTGQTIHATTVVLGELGVLIRGASGAGKSSLALALIALAGSQGRFARLVADDRTALGARGGRLLARPVAPLEGLIERRGLGLTPEPHQPAVVVRLIVDLSGEEPVRMPEPEDLVERIEGIDLPRLTVAGRAGDERLVLAALRLFTEG